jgi:diguanylate cyclase (GGDEF)-like protein
MNRNKLNFLKYITLVFIITAVVFLVITMTELQILYAMNVDILKFIRFTVMKGVTVIALFAAVVTLTIHLFHKEVNFDYMTKLCSRRKLFYDLNKLICSNKVFTLCFIDFDDFKHVNDTYGHAAGDELLKEFARRIMAIDRKIVTGYRIGGDEFVVIIKGTLEIEKYIKLITQVKNKPVKINYDVTVSFDFSMGIVDNDFVSTADELLKKADCSMYSKKRTRF